MPLGLFPERVYKQKIGHKRWKHEPLTLRYLKQSGQPTSQLQVQESKRISSRQYETIIRSEWFTIVQRLTNKRFVRVPGSHWELVWDSVI